jgi:hypothetical protein
VEATQARGNVPNAAGANPLAKGSETIPADAARRQEQNRKFAYSTRFVTS